MLRNEAPTAAIEYETPDGLRCSGGAGVPGTRRRFPQISASLAVRWCSAALKIDVMDAAIRGQERFLGRRTLVVTGERAQESPSRARYARFEAHRTDTRTGSRRRRHVDHWRSVHAWDEAQVWATLRQHRILPALPYRIGFGRYSCLGCIFSSPNALATLRHIAPDRFAALAGYEVQFGCTIKRTLPLGAVADRGTVFRAARDRPDLVDAALSARPYRLPVRSGSWELPAGAFGENDGPS